MRKLLLQLDSSRLPSVFDRVVAYDAAADEVMSYGAITEADIRDLIHGCIFTRGPKDLKHTAVFIGGADMAAGERLLAAAKQAFFGPFTVSVMLDSNGSNTTAVAAVAKMVQAAGGDVRGKRVLIVAGTGPVGIRAAGLFAKAGADVCITSRKADAGERARDLVLKRFGGTVRAIAMPDAKEAIRACERAVLVLNAGPAGVMLVPKQAWANRPGLEVVADVNAVPPLGVEGVDVTDDGVVKHGVRCFGALAIGNLKMKVHKACIARLFERNDLVLDAEALADPARFVGVLEAAGPLDCVVGPSGYGLPLTRAHEATEEDLRLAFLAAEGEPGGIGGLRTLARALARSALPVFFTPGVIHLPSVPAHRKVNRVDMGTAEKVCAAALAIDEQARRIGRSVREVSFVLLELGARSPQRWPLPTERSW